MYMACSECWQFVSVNKAPTNWQFTAQQSLPTFQHCERVYLVLIMQLSLVAFSVLRGAYPDRF
jgi:hypothetical protein